MQYLVTSAARGHHLCLADTLFYFFVPKIIIICTPVNPTLLRITLELIARTCEGDVSNVNLPVVENSGFSKSHFVDVFFIISQNWKQQPWLILILNLRWICQVRRQIYDLKFTPESENFVNFFIFMKRKFWFKNIVRSFWDENTS